MKKNKNEKIRKIPAKINENYLKKKLKTVTNF